MAVSLSSKKSVTVCLTSWFGSTLTPSIGKSLYHTLIFNYTYYLSILPHSETRMKFSPPDPYYPLCKYQFVGHRRTARCSIA